MERLKQFMDERGMSQADLARVLQYPPELISMMLNGKRKVSGGFKLKFVLVYGRPVYDAVFDPDAQPAEAALTARGDGAAGGALMPGEVPA